MSKKIEHLPSFLEGLASGFVIGAVIVTVLFVKIFL